MSEHESSTAGLHVESDESSAVADALINTEHVVSLCPCLVLPSAALDRLDHACVPSTRRPL